MKFKTNVIVSAVFAVLAFTSCSKTENKPPLASQDASLQNKVSENGTNPDEAIFSADAGAVASPSYFYTESNKRSGNTILVFSQTSNGQIILNDEVKSGGYGLGEGLGSQGAVAVSKEYNLLFAVNGGSNSVSSFRINKNTGGLTLLFTVYSLGNLTNSITVNKDKLYVLNTGTSNICGFTFSANGFLKKIEGSTHDLSGLGADARQIKFQPDGAAVYVTEKATNLIDKFSLDNNGAVVSAKNIQSNGIEPFGFDFARNNKFMIVTNAAGSASGAGSATSYKISASGLTDVNGPVGDYGTAPCWAATTKFGTFAFVANTQSNNLSSYYIDTDGTLTLIHGIAAADGKKPIDVAVSTDNKYVYAIYSGSHSIVAYKRKPAGVIELADKVSAIPDFAAGLAVY